MGKFVYFELSELLRSDTAQKRGIANIPTFEVVDHLEQLVRFILEPLRIAWGKAIRVTSGYRCPALNTAVGGSNTSVHMLGYAADLQTSGPFDVFVEFVVNWLKTNNIKFDQVLIESNKKTGARWIHIGLYNNYGQQRRIIRVQ